MPPSPDKDDVSTALTLLIDTLGEEEKRLKDEGTNAINNGEYDTATAVIQFAQRLLVFREEVGCLVEKWKELEDILDTAMPQVRKIFGGGNFSGKAPVTASRIRRSKIEVKSQSIIHCYHILEALANRGGNAQNQDLIVAVNKNVKMQYPQFKQAREIMADKGWTKNNGSNRELEISEKGRKWLARQQEKSKPVVPQFTRKAIIGKEPEPQDPHAGTDDDTMISKSPPLFAIPLQVIAARQERIKQNKGGCSSPAPPGKNDVPNNFQIRADMVVSAGDWIQHEALGFGKILKVNAVPIYSDRTDGHEVWFSDGKRDLRMTNHELRKGTVCVVLASKIPDAILKRAPSVK